MAYYDPHSSERYYDPRFNAKGDTGSMASAAGFIKQMAGYAILQGVASAALSLVGKGIGAAVKSRAMKNAPASLYAKRLSRIKNPGMKDVIKGFTPVRRFVKQGEFATRAHRRALNIRHRAIRQKMSVDRFAANKLRFTSVFKNRETFQGTMGSLFMRHAVVGSAISYGFDSAMGFTELQGIQSKPLYDVPGHVMNYMNYMRKNAGTFMAFGAMGGAFKAAHGATGVAVRNFFDKNTAFRDKTIQTLARLKTPNYGKVGDANFLQKQVRDMQAGSAHEQNFFIKSIRNLKAGVGTTVQMVNENLRTYMNQTLDHVKHATDNVNVRRPRPTAKETVANIIDDVKEIWKHKREAARMGPIHGVQDSPGLGVLETFRSIGEEHLSKGMPLNTSEKSRGGELLFKAVTDFNDQIKPKSFLADVLRLKPTEVGDVVNTPYIQKAAASVASYFPRGNTKQFEDALGKTFIGNHMFKSGKFQLDLSFTSPIHMAKRALGKLAAVNFNLPVGIPPIGRTISLGSITGLNSVLSQKVRSHHFRQSVDGLGFIADADEISEAGVTIRRAGIPKKLEQLIGESVGEGDLSSSDVSVSLIGGKFFAHDGTNLRQLNTRHTALKYSNSSIFGAAGEGKTAALRRWIFHNAKEDQAYINLQNVYEQTKRVRSSNPFNYFMHKFDWEVPRGIVNFADSIGRKLMPGRIVHPGKQLNRNQELIAQAVEGIFHENIDAATLKQHIPHLKQAMLHTDQEVGHLLRGKQIYMELAEQSKSKYLTKDVNIMHADQKFVDRLRDDLAMYNRNDKASNFTRLMDNPDAKAILNTTLQYPERAKDHLLFQRQGRLSAFTSLDYLKVNYINDGMDNAWDGISPHPFLDAADNLLSRNLITKNEASSMKLHGILKTLFKDPKMDAAMGGRVIDQSTLDYVKRVGAKFNRAQNVELQDLIRYIGDTDYRPTQYKFSAPSLLKRSSFEPWKLASKAQDAWDVSPFYAVSYDPNSKLRSFGFSMARGLDVASERLLNMVNDLTGLKREPLKYGNGFQGAMKYIGTRSAQVAGAVLAYRAADAFIAGNPVFDSTMLDDGMTGFLADNIAKTHLLSSKVANMTGIAGVGRHLEGLMPGFTSTAPGAVIGGALSWGNGPIGLLAGAFKGAIANRVLSPLMPDMTKPYEQLRKEYSGESDVPIIEGRMWFLGTTPWQGRSVVGWQPNWYTRAKSRWQSSDSLYGNEFRRFLHTPIFPIGVSLGDFVDPYYMERKHYFSRPYPESGDWGEEIPLGIGPLVSATIGKWIKPKKLMHPEFLHGTQGDSIVSALPPPSISEGLGMMKGHGTFNPRKFGARSSYQGTMVYSGSKMYGQQMADQTLDNFESALGLAGFGAHTIREALSPSATVMPTLETAGRIASQSRGYYDMNLGGLGIFSEVIRRFVTKPDWRKYGINPIPNLLPNWLPDRMTKGDPYAKILRGELRLPGPAYEKTHMNVHKSMPARASMFGGEVEHSIQYFTGLLPPMLKKEYDIVETGTAAHLAIQNWLASENLLVQAESLVYDVKNDISGHVDAIIRDGEGGRGRRAIEIKTISEAGLEKLSGPKYQHVGQLNFYLHQLKMKKGTLMYVSRDNPSNFRLFEVNYNRSRYDKDLEKLHKARSVASQMLAKGQEGSGYGYAYSWLDRMNILADVAPTSNEYKDAKWIVEQQLKQGMLTEKQIEKYHRAVSHRKAVIRKYELYPLRFKGQVMSPSAEYNLQSTNENIKAAAEYSLPERAIGAMWETFTNLNTPLVNKFFAFKDPLEHYKQYQIYGKEYTPWTDPYGSFIDPAIRNMAAAEDPLGGAVNWGLGPAYMLGGRVGAVLGAAAGGFYGAVNGAVRKLTNTANIPGDIESKREINDYFDKLKYYKNQRMAYLSTGLNRDQFTNQSRATLTSILNNGGSYVDFFRSVSHTEKPYIEAWLNEKDPARRESIARMIPERLSKAMRSYWHTTDDDELKDSFVDATSSDIAAGKTAMPYTTQELDPNIQLEDIKLKTINKAGLNAHDFGLGWQDQMMRVQNDLHRINAANLDSTPDSAERVNVGAIRSSILALFNNMGVNGTVSVYMNNHSDGNNQVNVTIQRSRLMELRDALSNRERFL